MGFRQPQQTVLDTTSTDVSGSVAGGWAFPFRLPQDCDSAFVKITPSVTAGGVSVIWQTSDDGGSTFYDVARSSIASNNLTGPHWMPVILNQGPTVRASVVAVGSVIAVNNIGPSNASTLGGLNGPTYSGLPVMGANRLFLVSTGNATAISARMEVKVNSQNRGN